MLWLLHCVPWCSAKLDAATTLLESLSDERSRWQIERDEAGAKLQSCLGDSLLQSCFIVYAGRFGQDQRLWMLSQWRERLMATGVFVHHRETPVQFFVGSCLQSTWRLQVSSRARAK